MAEVIDAARRHDEAFNAQDSAARVAAETPDIEAVLPGGLSFHGPEQLLELVKVFWEALPDARIVVHNQLGAARQEGRV